jgi:hypothetical protein
MPPKGEMASSLFETAGKMIQSQNLCPAMTESRDAIFTAGWF